MNRGILSTAALVSLVSLAFAAPATADGAEAGAPAPCAKQSRAVTTAKKAVAKAQKAKATSPKARKQRAKRIKAAKAKHTRARKALATCKAKVKAAPAPAPVPEPAPVPPPPVLSLAATTVSALEGFAVTVAAPAPPAGMAYRLAFRSRGTINTTCSFLAMKDNVAASAGILMQTQRPWCVGPGRVSLFQAVAGSKPLPTLGTEIAGIDVVVNPA